MHRLLYWSLIFCLFNISASPYSYSQSAGKTIVKGTVIDSGTGEPMPYVSVLLENTTVGTITDNQGRFNIATGVTSYRIKFSFLGYEPESRIISPGKIQEINIELNPTSVSLSEVVIKPSKRNYSNKNNPAVDLIEKVIANKEVNRIRNLEYYSFDKYEKVQFSLSNISEKFKQLRTFRKFNFIFGEPDSMQQEGKDTMPFFIKETLSGIYYRKYPKANKEIIRAEKTINFDEYIDNKGVSANLNYMYQNIDIYESYIFFLTNKFLSPVAAEAPLFYRFFIIDTSLVADVQCIKLFFEPRNPADFLFHGFLYVTSDSALAIKKIDMSFNKGINIDWVKDVRIVQDFEKTGHKSWALARDEVAIDFGITQNLPGLFGKRIVSFNKYSINEPIADSVFIGPDLVRNKDASEKADQYWESNRIPPLTKSEKGIYTTIDSVKKIPAFKHRMDAVMLFTTEFLNIGKFEIGPAGNFYSYNPIEGQRIRFGGRTTPEFNKGIYLEPYLAYGFNDKQFKYNLTATYSLTGTSIYKFPVKSIKLNYRYETTVPGQELQFATGDNIFLSLKRGNDDKMFYNKTYLFEYLNEFENHFSYTAGYNFTRQSPAGILHFYTFDEDIQPSKEIRYINIAETYLKLRYAPKEEFYQGKIYRDPVPSKYPVIQFQYTIGSKRLSNDFDYQKIELSISKRFYLAIAGYTDVTAEAGKIFGNVPYPVLFIHNANQTYSYQRHSYNMMNFLEFVSDKYVSLNIDHSFNGFFLNKIPVLKKLKFREVFTFKALYGGVRQSTDPDFNNEVFKFPAGPDGVPYTFTLERKPYMEASAGVSNVLKIFRVDLIKRLSYTDNLNVSTLGFRVQFRFDI